MPAGKPKDKNMVKASLVVLAWMFYKKAKDSSISERGEVDLAE